MEKLENASEFNINTETGMIISNRHEYANIPRMHELIRRANRIRESLPAVPSGFTRLWRGNRPNEIGKNPSFTNSLEGIALPFLNSYGGKLTYVDVSTEELSKYLDTIGGAADSEFILSPELASTAEIVDDSH